MCKTFYPNMLLLEKMLIHQAVDCSILERMLSETSLVKHFEHGYCRRQSQGGGNAPSRKAMRFFRSWKKWIEQFRLEVDRVIFNGLGLKPKILSFRLRAGLKGLLQKITEERDRVGLRPLFLESDPVPINGSLSVGSPSILGADMGQVIQQSQLPCAVTALAQCKRSSCFSSECKLTFKCISHHSIVFI
jgi:hypothetical protein